MLSAVPAHSGRGDHLGDLVAAVRPEFCGEAIAVSPEDPVFGRGRCGVAGCGRSAWARDLYGAHHQRWANHAKPDLGEFKAGAAAVAVRTGSENANGFDLSALAVGPRLEVAYVLQCRHDDRTVRVPPPTVRHLVALVADSGAGSLLDRPLEDWLDEVRSRGLKDPSPTIGLIRYARRRLSDLGGIDIEAEYASDVNTSPSTSATSAKTASPPRQRHVSHMKPKLRTTTAPSPPDKNQQPDQTRQTRRVRVHQLRQLPHPSPALRRQTQLGTARNPHSDLKREEPLFAAVCHVEDSEGRRLQQSHTLQYRRGRLHRLFQISHRRLQSGQLRRLRQQRPRQRLMRSGGWIECGHDADRSQQPLCRGRA